MVVYKTDELRQNRLTGSHADTQTHRHTDTQSQKRMPGKGEIEGEQAEEEEAGSC